MNINSFLTCPRCFRMHEARVEVCLGCDFSHPPVLETVTVATEGAEVPVVDNESKTDG